MKATSAPAHSPAPGVRGGSIVPDPPPRLTQRIEEAVGSVAAGRSMATATPEIFLAAAERLFGRVLSAGCASRTSALDLLVVDALVTYAFERASDEPACIEDRADRAMAALARLPTATAASVAK